MGDEAWPWPSGRASACSAGAARRGWVEPDLEAAGLGLSTFGYAPPTSVIPGAAGTPCPSQVRECGAASAKALHRRLDEGFPAAGPE